MSDPGSWAPLWPGPLPLQVMMQRQWDVAFEYLYPKSATAFGERLETWLARTRASDDRAITRATIQDVIETAFDHKMVEYALAWSFLAADPSRPETIQCFLPQVAALFEKTLGEGGVYTDGEIKLLRATMNVWMDAAAGQYVDAKLSVFAIASRSGNSSGREAFERLRSAAVKTPDGDDVSDATGLVVMPRETATKLTNELSHWKALIGKRLPFVMAPDVDHVQATLRAEYPHAAGAIELLTRELRAGKPVRLKPVILLGDPGSGKSRMVRRLAELLGMGTSLYRFDASSVGDSLSWSGTARGWGNTTPSVPARAVQQAMKSNPLVLIEEIEKSGRGGWNGSIYAAMTPYLDRETSKRLRDLSLDAELDLSWCSFLATANDDTTIPSHIRDRFRVVKVPLPTLVHLRPLARNIMADMAAEEDMDPRWMAPLDLDEEAVVAKAWERVGFSIRKLQKIVSATLDARDAYAPRN